MGRAVLGTCSEDEQFGGGVMAYSFTQISQYLTYPGDITIVISMVGRKR